MKVAICFVFCVAFPALILVEAFVPPFDNLECSRIAIVCNINKEGCRQIATTVKGCLTCACLPPKGSCPQLTSCRQNCTYFVNSNECVECRNCPDEPSRCTEKCNDGEIKGNPDENGCDTCIPSPKCDLAIDCPEGCDQVNDERECPVSCSCPINHPICGCNCSFGGGVVAKRSPMCVTCDCLLAQ